MLGPSISRRRPLLASAGVLFAGILALTFAVDDPRQAVTVLFVVPIALCALAAGRRGGFGGALLATALLVLWTVTSDAEIGTVGWTSRLAAFFVLGVLVGRYEDLARGYERRRLNEDLAAEVHDGVVQSLVLARYDLDRGATQEATGALDDALDAAKRIITDRMAGDDVRPGDLRLAAPSHPPRRESSD